MMKLAVTFIAVEFFDILYVLSHTFEKETYILLVFNFFFLFSDLEEYDFQLQQDKMDYGIALEITSKILCLEILNKFIVCLYEVSKKKLSSGNW